MTAHPPILLIDASIYIFQYYFSLTDHWFSEEEQWPTAAVYGYSAFLVRLLSEHQPKRIAACFDESLGQCFRNEIYEDYKASRALPDEALAFQLAACREVSELLGIRCFSSLRYEADDLIGSLYHRCKRSQSPIAVLTRDKDLGQLLQRDKDYLWDYAKDTLYYAPDIVDKVGVLPHQLVDYLALVGDSIDDIPGVPGVGKKTAQQLLSHFGSIKGLFQQLNKNPQVLEGLAIRGAKRLSSVLDEYREQIAIAQQLATIVTDLPLIDRIADVNRETPDFSALEHFCQRMGFPKLYTTIQRTL